ncbi:putative NADH dehydrogenase, F subunit [Selenomonas ruminantium subsp. lactilytica TAM6421]|uniref:Putative NADH dehydrogenase, F subunit n=1 Tax=Selenomonas ruminantium subsp. lactilytica (strain NBRC 103574 / TAM6421) TaxID=927704 RepID=I0GUA6_SELRL|nr:NADH-ubiquinone oxidoreductase-F iron-sulfur binding region domain-containing protein [Selenomonas ruminantium]BAL84343.1 putative NADH dehydrogenase, F subunit [Selenomonas ruminantium subsp. lactilytica TAM6421]
MSTQVRFLTKNFGAYDVSSIGAYMNIGGFKALRKAVTMDPEDICTMLSDAKIRGRGGAEYPLGRKWSQARAVKGENKVIICNADEGETTTFKDRELIKNDPFNLIEAMIIAGFVCGATDGYIYMRAEYACYRPILLNAIRQAKNYGFLGENILGKGFDFNIHLYSGGGAYVCGEGTALIRSIEGKAGRPRMKPPFIKVSGVFARPTCLNNVESLSLVPHLLLDKDTYMNCGMGESIGTKLVSVAGNVNNPGVFEIPFGTTVRDIIYNLAGGLQHDREIQLIQFGGASGKVSDASILDTPYTYDDLRAAGVMVGSGGMLVIDKRTSVLDFLRMNQEFFSEESCGQCTPCREGNLHIKIILDKLAKGEATEQDIKTMGTIAKVMSMSSLCGLGETAQNTLQSAMKKFPEVFDLGGTQA